MLKLLKWIYELGANQENARIKSIIEQTKVQADYKYREFEGMLFDEKISDVKRQRVTQEQQGQLARIHLIEAITQQTGDYVIYNPIDRPKAKK